MAESRDGQITLFGSGETSPTAGRIFEEVAQRLAGRVRVAILETPAGFEVNSARVAGRVADFLRQRLQNYPIDLAVIPARKRGTPFSPDDPDLLRPMLQANLIFLGPGSPTYAVRQLQNSLAWYTLIGRHRLGAVVALASAATIAASAYALPVYEIYKAGEDLHWRAGLNLFGPYGLSLVFVPHWNNAEGGADLDTSRCFMGRERFSRLRAMLPADATIVGIDEHTGLTIDFQTEMCRVAGRGNVTIIRPGGDEVTVRQDEIPLSIFGAYHHPDPRAGLPAAVWEALEQAQIAAESHKSSAPVEILALVEERQLARTRRDWAVADGLRQRLSSLGWSVLDTPEGPRIEAI